ncbi:MAG: hypothetical protein KAS18_01040, partial [Calditrichia bacterium]|nr:hypothetical protein [Calditrichia bacterium]
MNITLSADKSLIEKARRYAKKQNTSLNNLVRNYLKSILNDSDNNQAAEEFEKNALSFAGKSNSGFKFNRDEIYNRG